MARAAIIPVGFTVTIVFGRCLDLRQNGNSPTDS